MANLESIGGIHYEMMKRCYNEKSVAFKSYGGKGIKVFEQWHDRDNFRKWCNENGYEKGLRLNRIDSSKDYTPDNCVFGRVNCKIEGGKNQEIKKRIAENKKKKAEAGIIGRASDDTLYYTFMSIHERCENPKHINYKNYGQRGISVCKEWSRKGGFLSFRKWANENGWKEGLSIDRIDNNKGYEPSNCRWVTKKQQAYNKRCSVIVEYSGIKMPLGMVAKLEDLKYSMLYSRVKQKGMEINEAIADIKKSGS